MRKKLLESWKRNIIYCWKKKKEEHQLYDGMSLMLEVGTNPERSWMGFGRKMEIEVKLGNKGMHVISITAQRVRFPIIISCFFLILKTNHK